jgi:hypothetical protein
MPYNQDPKGTVKISGMHPWDEPEKKYFITGEAGYTVIVAVIHS